MTVLNFPPTAGEATDGSFTYEENGVVYSWDGVKWTAEGDAAFWSRTGTTLSPTNDGDIVQTGGNPQSAVVGARMRGDIGTMFTCVPSNGVALGIYEEGKTQRNCSINSDGSATFGSLVQVNTEGYRADNEGVFSGQNAAGTVTSVIRGNGSATFAGNVQIGTTSQPSPTVGGSGFYSNSQGRMVLRMSTTTNTVGTQIATFYHAGSNNGGCGSISVGGGATVFATSSDYRLKENVKPLNNATSRLLNLKPVNFNFIGYDRTLDGFLAHEAQQVVPEAVVGKKDGEDMQQIDQSKLVPLLTKALQESITRIEQLEAEVAALKGGN
jgi:hypothetical protein